MLVICEDCAKKYNIDESRIKGKRARFTCNECGHIIIVNKADLRRPLVQSSNQRPDSPASSIDLLKEMEAPLFDSSENQDATSTSQQEDIKSDQGVSEQKKKKGLAITGYFLIGGVISFLLINGGIGYILSLHYAKISSQQMQLHSEMLTTVLLVLLGTWAVSFCILFGIGLYLSKAVNSLTRSVSKVNQGEREVNFKAKGPRELTNMAKALSELCSRIR